MELHQLRYFVAVVENGTFSRAAERVHVAQPSLSQQVRKLEDELGQPLFNRLGRSVELTDGGRQLLTRAREILRQVDDTQRQLQESSSGEAATLTVGALPMIAPYFLPPVMERFHREQPNVTLCLQEELTTRLVQEVIDGQLDFAIVALPINDPRLREEDLFAEPFYVVLPRDHRLAKRKAPVTFKDLKNEAFILLHDMHRLGDKIMRICRHNEYHPNVLIRTLQLDTMHQFVARGFGISIVPEMARKEHGDGHVYRPLSGKNATRRVGVIWRKKSYRSKTAGRFIEMLKEARSEAPGARASSPVSESSKRR